MEESLEITIQGRNNAVQPGIPKIHCQESTLSYAPLFHYFVPPITLACSVGERAEFQICYEQKFHAVIWKLGSESVKSSLGMTFIACIVPSEMRHCGVVRCLLETAH